MTKLTKLAAELPARERELIALKYGAGLSNRLIARLASLSESNVGVALTMAGESVMHDEFPSPTTCSR